MVVVEQSRTFTDAAMGEWATRRRRSQYKEEAEGGGGGRVIKGFVRDKKVVRLGGFAGRKEGFRRAGTVAMSVELCFLFVCVCLSSFLQRV
jgi:hypothetical protein